MMANKWSVAEQARFLKRTGELLTRGYPLAEAIESLSFYLEKTRKEDIKKSLDQLREGYPLYLILSQLKFNKDLVNYVYFAEQHGGLAHAVTEGSEMVLRRESDYQRLKKLAAYPLFLMVMTGVLFFFVDKVLLPKFTSLFSNMNLTPNLFMQAIQSTAHLFPLLFYSLVFLLVIVFGYYYFIFQSLPPIEQKVKLTKIPFAGKLLKLFYTHFFAIQLSYLFTGGLSVLDALKVFEHNTREAFSMELGKDIILKLAMGQDLPTAVTAYPFFEEELARIVKHGQENGKLDQELYFYSRHCLKQLEERSEKTMKIVQPVLYSFIGVLIISLYLAILLPMFQLIQGI
jgi:competence protein ComGB